MNDAGKEKMLLGEYGALCRVFNKTADRWGDAGDDEARAVFADMLLECARRIIRTGNELRHAGVKPRDEIKNKRRFGIVCGMLMARAGGVAVEGEPVN